MKVYQMIASNVFALERCQNDDCIVPRTAGMVEKHKENLSRLMKECMPSGSGFDNGTKLDIDRSTPESLEFTTQFHHMNDDGFYTEWTGHRVVVTPSLVFGIVVEVFGDDENDIHDHISEAFTESLMAECRL